MALNDNPDEPQPLSNAAWAPVNDGKTLYFFQPDIAPALILLKNNSVLDIVGAAKLRFERVLDSDSTW